MFKVMRKLKVVNGKASRKRGLLEEGIGYITEWCKQFHYRAAKYNLQRLGQVQCCSVIVAKMSTSERMGHRNPGTKVTYPKGLLEEQDNICREAFLAALREVIPSELVRRNVKRSGNIITINNQVEIPLDPTRKCFVVGFGKAVLPMAETMMEILGTAVNRCVLSVPEGIRESRNPSIELYRGAKNNLPDSNAQRGAEEIVKVVRGCKENDVIIPLISGGGSALLPLPQQPITLEEKAWIIGKLSKSGATIHELNTVRKKLSAVKGGRLARMCPSSNIYSLILSDVLGDDLDIIASGPTVPNPDPWDAALRVVQKYVPNLAEIPESIKSVLLKKEEELEDNLRPKARNFLVGYNKLALNGSFEKIRSDYPRTGYVPFILTSRLEGEAKWVGRKLGVLASAIADDKILDASGVLKFINELNILEFQQDSHLAKEFAKNLVTARKNGSKICLLLGGETTVSVVGSGRGGRNQELALAAALQLHQMKPKACVTILSAGTDGIDGPCPVAGALVNPLTVEKALVENLNPVKFLANNDSYHFFKDLDQGSRHILTGHTETNVMDLIIVLIDPSNGGKKGTSNL